jgi:hypothetical protein
MKDVLRQFIREVVQNMGMAKGYGSLVVDRQDPYDETPELPNEPNDEDGSKAPKGIQTGRQ